MDFRKDTVRSLADRVHRREISAGELVSHALERISAVDGAVRAFVAVDDDAAVRRARAIDAALAQGADPGPLAGIPIGVKDLEDAAGFVTTHGSAAFASGPPAEGDSPLVARLKGAGAVVVGKTNTPELGWKAETDNRTFGPTRNPWSLSHSPGGSSGGSAAAIAAGMVPLATGSDGGGSIRIPSSCCGLSGVKPSLGRVPSGGADPPGWPDLSTKGVMGRTVLDVVDALDVAVGPDPTDLRSLPRPEASWRAALEEARPPMRVAWSPTLGYAPVDAEVRILCQKAVSTLADIGAEVEEVDTVFSKDPIGVYLTLTNVFGLRTLAPFQGTDVWERLDPGLVAMVESAETVLAVDLVRAMDQCHRCNLALVELFHRFRLLVTPTCAAPPPESGQLGVINGISDPNWIRFTYPFNLTRSPAATVCAGFTSTGLPVGVQLVGPQHGDVVVIRAAAALEQALGLEQLAPIGA